MYYGNSQRQKVVVGQKKIWVDSKLEAQVVRWLEANGFSGRWARPGGLEVDGARYTFDLELAIEYEGKTARALVEVKPTKRYLIPSIRRRMCAVSYHYKDPLILLYVGKDRTWHLVDRKTGKLSAFGTPIPGLIEIAKLPKPFALPSSRTRSHVYEKRFHPILSPVGFILETLVTIINGPKKHKK